MANNNPPALGNAPGGGGAGLPASLVDVTTSFGLFVVGAGKDAPCEFQPMRSADPRPVRVTSENGPIPKGALVVGVQVEGQYQDARFTKPTEFYLHTTAVDRRIVYLVMTRTPPPPNADSATLLAYQDELVEKMQDALVGITKKNAPVEPTYRPSHLPYVQRLHTMVYGGRDTRGILEDVPQMPAADLPNLHADQNWRDAIHRRIVSKSTFVDDLFLCYCATMGDIPPGANATRTEMLHRLTSLESNLKRVLTHRIDTGMQNANQLPIVFPAVSFHVYRPSDALDDDGEDDSVASSDDESFIEIISDDEDEDEEAPAGGDTPPVPPGVRVATDNLWPMNIYGDSLTQTPEYCWYYDIDDPHEINVVKKLCPNDTLEAIEEVCDPVGRGYVLLSEDCAQKGTVCGRRIPSILAESNGRMVMPELQVRTKHGEVYQVSWAVSRCRVLFSRLLLVEQGILLAKPMSIKIWHGYFVENGANRVYHVLDQKCRLSIATHGDDASAISRNQQGYSTTTLQTRIRALALMATRIVTEHVRIQGTRAQNGFQRLNPGESWQIGNGSTRHAAVESDFRACLDVAKYLIKRTYRVMDTISCRLAPEVAEDRLPPNRIVFPACRPSAFHGNGAPRNEISGATGMRKPDEYWNALLPSRVKYYNNAESQSIGNGPGKDLAVEAGDAVKRLGLPIFIAMRINGHLRYFHLFPDYVDYRCYYDLRVWQDFAPDQHKYPALMQP